jgi:hypothetical protein
VPSLFELLGVTLSARAHRLASAGLALVSVALIAAPALS